MINCGFSSFLLLFLLGDEAAFQGKKMNIMCGNLSSKNGNSEVTILTLQLPVGMALLTFLKVAKLHESMLNYEFSIVQRSDCLTPRYM